MVSEEEEGYKYSIHGSKDHNLDTFLTINMNQTNYTEPLFVDTTLEYEIDRSRFPGIDNGQPMLLIHTSTDCPCTTAHPSIIVPVADHELYTLLDTLAEVVSAKEQIQPENESSTCDLVTSSFTPLLQSPTDDMCCDVTNDREHKGLDSPLNTPDVLSDLSTSSSSDSHPSAILDDQLFPCSYDLQGSGDLFDDLSTICGISLCNIGMKTRKRRHSTVYETSPKRRKTECCWVADLFEDEADLRWSS